MRPSRVGGREFLLEVFFYVFFHGVKLLYMLHSSQSQRFVSGSMCKTLEEET